MNVIVDSLVELSFKSGPALRFNVMFQLAEGTYIAVPGFRWMDSCIHPPVIKNKNAWYPTAFLGQNAAECLYDALLKKLEDLDLTQKYPLMPVDIATEELIVKAKMCRYFPDMLKKDFGIKSVPAN
jgi:hypothetical protein